ncbi:hypothetical protein BJP34_17945 [Moorena producens PAL-8-15-08-1]|uniref:Putative restriction endonuclease domain-containing protein n=2 Tax=Moorena TaxID=1155738 RepID=A0A1D8TTU1_9CYAN|nr:hypothetical protein BJP34_17945 [Moorena producens PAL-8-15-08-1]
MAVQISMIYDRTLLCNGCSNQSALHWTENRYILKISPQGTPHATSIRLTRRLLDNRLREQGLVQTQLPVQLSNYSEPQPDLAVVIADELRYLDHHPTPS